MFKPKIALIIMIVAATGLVVSLLIRQRSQTELQRNENQLHEQERQLAEISQDNQRLSNLVTAASGPVATDHGAELAKLRSEANALRKQTNDLAKQMEARRASQPPAAAPVEHPREYWEQLHQMSGAKGTDARTLASAMLEYALEHQGQFPTNTQEMASYIAKPERSLSGTNRFEIVYHGTIDSLQGVARSAVALVRDLDTWPGPDGKMVRVYGLADGTGQLIHSDDNFQAWESQHIISQPKHQSQ